MAMQLSDAVMLSRHASDPFRRQFAAVDAVGNADAVIGVAGQLQIGQRRHAGLDPRDQLLVADVILRHRAGPMGDVAVARLAANPQQPRQLAEHQRPQLGVVHFGQFRPARPAHEHPQQLLSFRRPMRILPAAETARQDGALLDGRNDRAHAVQRMADLVGLVAERNDGRAGVGDRSQIGGQRRVDRLQQLGRHRRGRGEDQGIE